MCAKKREEKHEHLEQKDPDVQSHRYVRTHWTARDPLVLPEECQAGKCTHPEHWVKAKKHD